MIDMGIIFYFYILVRLVFNYENVVGIVNYLCLNNG